MKLITATVAAVLFSVAHANPLNGVADINRRKTTDVSELSSLTTTDAGSCGWVGTAPFCDPSCPPGWYVHQISSCGDGSCCWTGNKYFCCDYPPTAEEQADMAAFRAGGAAAPTATAHA